jgi:hypothetical protein
MKHPKVVGDRSTLAIMVALHELGLPLLTPYGENTRYDLVIEIGGKLTRVQCKTGRLRKGAVFFRPGRKRHCAWNRQETIRNRACVWPSNTRSRK